MNRALTAACAAGLALLGGAAPAGAHHHRGAADAVGTWNTNAGKAAVAAAFRRSGRHPRRRACTP